MHPVACIELASFQLLIGSVVASVAFPEGMDMDVFLSRHMQVILRRQIAKCGEINSVRPG
jgi:hypothetical protein